MECDRPPPPSDVSRLIVAACNGEAEAANDLMAVVYDELKRLAYHIFGNQQHGHTLEPTALVHEAWMRMAGNIESLNGKRHFFAVAAKAMRQVLSNHARDARTLKRGGGRHSVTLVENTLVDDTQRDFATIDLIALDDALARLATLNERHARVSEMRLLSAMTIQEIADELGTSKRAIEYDWSMAQAWLSRELS